ncbi:lysosomal amino acid transporter 1 isoform X1 [Medicago truncatula]|uniref:PQ-loop protein/transmembrane family protein n=1 Tax=Medicago truncatula TaxID=3880 RepID=G7LFJ3_MEDTR|nr:lysosomal amino acid transporter 1 isoform X1 [Medicago truncatula]AET03980.2 PQ-loop protein/transmembrane family protein [Medicago truncatula]
MAPSYCVKENKECVKWVETYFKDCLCNLRDDISFSLGLMSLVSWGVAEIPQIITIFRNKSSHGISLAFLLTWVAGDICNLVGCLLEPATLPTQFYTALLYASTTIILLLQIVYYDHILRWCKHRQNVKSKLDNEEEKRPLNPKPSQVYSGIAIPNGTQKEAARGEYYYMSARSLAGSATPPSFTHLRAAKSGPSALEFIHDSSDDDEASQVTSNISTTKPWSIPRSVDGRYGTFLATAINLPLKGNSMRYGYIGFTGIKLLKENEVHSTYGQYLGWIMAAIYTCSRIPQIWLNIKRGSVEGLNPFMFVFALIANTSYVGSILVRTTEFESIKANLPWLLDATVCVALDFFIISQYIYYRYFRSSESSDDGEYLK